jgi:hypothetical protein
VNARKNAIDAALDAFGKFRLRRRAEQSGAPVKAIDFDENGAGFRSAAAAQHRERAFMRNATDQSCNENVGA